MSSVVSVLRGVLRIYADVAFCHGLLEKYRPGGKASAEEITRTEGKR